LLIKRAQIVDGGEICWGEVMRTTAGEIGCGYAGSVVHGFAAEIVQRNHASYNLGESHGDFRIARAGVVDFAANLVSMNLSMKG